ncbi:hypothetical protein [Brucella sp. 09RB8471]|uniref:hypothetical protein n=1 Tax=Brucella sp. 09RB8471 TaxID=1149952 RepID=UPI00349EC243
MTVRTIDDIFRDFVTDGVPASGPFNPHKPDIRDTLKALLEGISTFPDNRVIRLNNANEGTANNIVVTASVAIPAAAYQVLYILNVTQENTGPVTVSGAINRDLVTNINQPVPAGYLTPGMALLCIDTGTELRLLSYGDAEAVQAAAEAAADRAEEAAAVAEAAAGGLLSNFSSRSEVEVTIIPTLVSFLRTAGYYAAGDGGGALYKRSASEPIHAGKVQSSDGAWWELSETRPNVLMFGTDRSGVTESTQAFLEASTFSNSAYVPNGDYVITEDVGGSNFLWRLALGATVSGGDLLGGRVFDRPYGGVSYSALLGAGIMRDGTGNMAWSGLSLGGLQSDGIPDGPTLMHEGLPGDEGSLVGYCGTPNRSMAVSLAPSGYPENMNNEDTASLAFQLRNGTGDGHSGEIRGGIAMKKWGELRFASFRTSAEVSPIPYMSWAIQDRKLCKMADDNIVRFTNELIANGGSGGNTITVWENPAHAAIIRLGITASGGTIIERLDSNAVSTTLNLGAYGVAIGGQVSQHPIANWKLYLLEARNLLHCFRQRRQHLPMKLSV